MPKLLTSNKIQVSAAEVAAFNRQWPCSSLRASRSYWFEFDEDNDLVDTDCPEHDDGPAAVAMADDCKAFKDGTLANWMY